MFNFKGPIASSKSWMNRALVIQHYNPAIGIIGSTNAADVKHLERALTDLKNGKTEFDLGEGGTTLRFFSFLVSRNAGAWNLNIHPKLLSRPQSDLVDILDQLDVKVKLHRTGIEISSAGWRLKELISCRGDASSQFISGLLLNAWQLEDDLCLEIAKPLVSAEYLEMTLKILELAGMKILRTENEKLLSLSVEKKQTPKKMVLSAEPDVSSAFSLAGAAIIGGQVEITNWHSEATQPDSIFLKILKKMDIDFSLNGSNLILKKQSSWNGVTINLKDSPDLFPVLAVLCGLATGASYLFGAEHLKAKESDRIAKTHELLSLCGITSSIEKDGMKIYGQGPSLKNLKSLVFHPEQDHRMAMAAGLLKLAGYKLHILHPQVVDKSYPTFWNDIQVSP